MIVGVAIVGDCSAEERWWAEAERLAVVNARLEAENASLRSRVAELEGQVAVLSEKVATLAKLVFGVSSEKKSPAGPGVDSDAENTGGDHGEGGQRRPRRC